MSTRSTQSAGIDVLMAHEASTEGTPSRFGQGWPSSRCLHCLLYGLERCRKPKWERAGTKTRTWEQATRDPIEPLTPGKLQLVTEAAIAACDGADGVRDRIVTDPEACMFDPGVLACSSGDGPAAITECR